MGIMRMEMIAEFVCNFIFIRLYHAEYVPLFAHGLDTIESAVVAYEPSSHQVHMMIITTTCLFLSDRGNASPTSPWLSVIFRKGDACFRGSWLYA
jgi:hypothetical protein